MAGASSSVYELTSMVRGKYVYKSILTPLTDKTLRASSGKTATSGTNTL